MRKPFVEPKGPRPPFNPKIEVGEHPITKEQVRVADIHPISLYSNDRLQTRRIVLEALLTLARLSPE